MRREIIQITGIGLALLFLCVPTRAEIKLKDKSDRRMTHLEHFDIFSEYEINKKDLLEVRRYLKNARRSVGRDLGQFPKGWKPTLLAVRYPPLPTGRWFEFQPPVVRLDHAAVIHGIFGTPECVLPIRNDLSAMCFYQHLTYQI